MHLKTITKKCLILIMMIGMGSNFLYMNFSVSDVNLDELQVDQSNNDFSMIPAVSTIVSDSVWGAYGGNGSSGTGNKEFNNPVDICANTSGYLFVADWNNDRIQRFKPDGTYDGEISYPEPLCVRVDPLTDILYVTSFDLTVGNEVALFHTNGTYIKSIGGVAGINAGEFIGATSVSMNSTHLFISDNGNHRIQIFDKAGNFVSMFGKDGGLYGEEGFESGEFSYPDRIGVNSTGQIYVYDYGNDRIQVFEPGSFSVINIYDFDTELNGDYIYINGSDNVFVGNKIYDPAMNLIDTIAPINSSNEIDTLNGPSGIACANGYIYVSDYSANRISLFKYESAEVETISIDLDYRSVGGRYNITSEIWRFGNITSQNSGTITSYSCSETLKYRIGTSSWVSHPKFINPPLNVSCYNTTTQSDLIIDQFPWGNTDSVLMANLIWKYNTTGAEIAAIMSPALDPLFDTTETGTNWVRFTSTNPTYSNNLIYIKVNNTGYLEEYYMRDNRRDVFHIILEEDIEGFLASRGVVYQSLSKPIYMTTGNSLTNQIPASSSLRVASSGNEYPTFPYDAQEAAVLFRITPTTTQNTVVSYENDHLNETMDDSKFLSEPKIETQVTQQLATVEYFDEDTGSWQPSDNGNGGNTFIIGNANKDSNFPLMIGQDLQFPLIFAENISLPTSEDIQQFFDSDVVMNVTGNKFYIEYTYDGIDFYVDVEYEEDGSVSKLEYRLPTTSGTSELNMTTISETEANEYVVNHTPGDENTNTDTDTDDGYPSDDFHITKFLIPIIISAGVVVVILVVVIVVKKKK